MDDDTIVELQGVIDKLEDLITESCVNLNEVLFFISPVESEVLNPNRGPMVGDLVARAVYDSFHLVHRYEFEVLEVRKNLHERLSRQL